MGEAGVDQFLVAVLPGLKVGVTAKPPMTAQAAASRFVATDTLRWHHRDMPLRSNRSRRQTDLHLPRRWPWADAFTQMLTALRSVQLAI